MDQLIVKIIGASVVQMTTKQTYPYKFLYTQYKKDDDIFWVKTVLVNCSDSHALYELMVQVDDVEEDDEVLDDGDQDNEALDDGNQDGKPLDAVW